MNTLFCASSFQYKLFSQAEKQDRESHAEKMAVGREQRQERERAISSHSGRRGLPGKGETGRARSAAGMRECAFMAGLGIQGHEGLVDRTVGVTTDL